MARGVQHVAVIRPDFRKARRPRRNEVGGIAGPDKHRGAQAPSGLREHPTIRIRTGERGSTCPPQRGNETQPSVPGPVCASIAVPGSAGEWRRSPRECTKPKNTIRGTFGTVRLDHVAHQFGIRIVQIALSYVCRIEVIHQPRSRLSEMKRPLSSRNRGNFFSDSQ